MRVKASAALAALVPNSMSHVSSIASSSANRRSATTLSHHLSPIFPEPGPSRASMSHNNRQRVLCGPCEVA